MSMLKRLPSLSYIHLHEIRIYGIVLSATQETVARFHHLTPPQTAYLHIHQRTMLSAFYVNLAENQLFSTYCLRDGLLHSPP